MSVVICYATKNLSLILTDKRISYGRHAEYGYSDANEKLIDLNEMGFAAGAGAGDYLDELKHCISNTNITEVKDMINIYQNITNSFTSNSIYTMADIDRSAVVASWIGWDEHFTFLKFNIGILSSEHITSEGMKSVGLDQIFILYPADFIEDETKITNLLNVYGCEYTFDGDLNKLYEKIFLIFKEISQNSNYVSSTCDIGLQLLGEDGIYKIVFSGEIMDLICEVNENRINERYKIVSKISGGN